MGLNAASMCQPMGGVGPGAVSIAPPASSVASSLRGSVSSGNGVGGGVSTSVLVAILVQFFLF
jgi:hypothetical protein